MIYPSDIEDAYTLWGANCGPCAVAAILNRQVNDVRSLFPGFEKRKYTNIGHVKEALRLAGVSAVGVGARKPAHGLMFVQWGGHEKKSVYQQYRYTHWIAISDDVVFEVNAPHLTEWISWQEVMPEIIKEEKRGNGTFFIRSGIEIIRPARIERV